MARILVLSPYEPPSDGIAKHTEQLVTAWDSVGHSVLVASPGRQAGLKDAEIIGGHSMVVRVLRKLPSHRVAHELTGFRPDVVFVQFAIAALSVNLWSVRSLCKKFAAEGTPVIVGYHEPAREYNLLRSLTRLIYRSFARLTDVPIAFSFAGRRALVESGLFDEVTEVPHGTIGIAEIHNDDIERVRELYGVRKPLVLTLGFTSFDKGTDVLLDAALEIAESRGNDVQFLIAGAPRSRRGIFRIMGRRDVNWQQELETRAGRIDGIDIEFVGYVADRDVAPLLRLADVVALPYRKITQSGVANLALSSCAVVVGSNLLGLRSDLGDAAIYVEPGDPSALAKEIACLLGDAADPERQRMRKLSGERAAKNTYARVAEQILFTGLEDSRSTDIA